MDENPQPDNNEHTPGDHDHHQPHHQYFNEDQQSSRDIPPTPIQPPLEVYSQIPQPAVPAVEHHPSNPGLIVLQWLTYAFWGWTVVAMSVLTVTVMANFIAKSDTGEFTPYSIAAVLVLLPISIICDVFYSKHEPAKKTGGASLVMILHAVLFALLAIGSLIGIVVSLVSMFTSSGDLSGSRTALFSTAIIAVLYAALFLRTIGLRQTPGIRRFFPIFMTLVVGVITVFGIIGPVANARLTRDDRLISDNLSTVQQGVSDYATSNNKLPNDLNNLDLSGDSQKLAQGNLITYKPNTKPSTIDSTQYSSTTYPDTATKTRIYYYQLCVNYKKASSPGYTSDPSVPLGSDDYSSYVSSYDHPAGNVCYKLQTSAY